MKREIIPALAFAAPAALGLTACGGEQAPHTPAPEVSTSATPLAASPNTVTPRPLPPASPEVSETPGTLTEVEEIQQKEINGTMAGLAITGMMQHPGKIIKVGEKNKWQAEVPFKGGIGRLVMSAVYKADPKGSREVSDKSIDQVGASIENGAGQETGGIRFVRSKAPGHEKEWDFTVYQGGDSLTYTVPQDHYVFKQRGNIKKPYIAGSTYDVVYSLQRQLGRLMETKKGDHPSGVTLEDGEGGTGQTGDPGD